MKTVLFRLGRTLLLTYIVLLLLVAGCQNRLLYQPHRGSEEDEIAAARRGNMEPWRDLQGRLIGWQRPNPRALNRMVVFHGNAGSALDRRFYIDAFQSLAGGHDWEVFIFEYPGYGSRSGQPCKAAFSEAGRLAVRELLAADSRPVFLVGESIGSGTACLLASEMPDRVAGLALVVPFSRLKEVAQKKFPWLPVGLLLRDRFDNIASLASFKGRVAVVVAGSDEVVGADQGRKLYESYRGSKLLIVLEGAGHNSFEIEPTAGWFQKVTDHLLPRN